MTAIESAREFLDERLEVYQVKDPEINRMRQEEKERVIAWTVSELQKGWLPEGSRAELPGMIWRSDYWEGVRGAVLIYYDRKCAVCGGHAKEVHHIRPREYGGKDHPRNLLPLCRGCHEEIHRRLNLAMTTAIAATTIGATSHWTQQTLEGYR